MLDRGKRPGEKVNLDSMEAFGKRYDDYNDFTDDAIAAMAEFVPVVHLNAEPDMEDVWESFYSAIRGLSTNR